MRLIFESNELDKSDEILQDECDKVEEALEDCVGKSKDFAVDVMKKFEFEFDYNTGYLDNYTTDVYMKEFEIDGETIAEFQVKLGFEIIKSGTKRSAGDLETFDVNYVKY